jgi:nitroimidazol reductase NimA-like FMN-containing flavoprotein (pyridoxamine 5'-phosphate oxidase superfamily)
MSVELVELGRAECVRLLRQHEIGRLSVTIDGQPHIVPVTYSADEDATVVFRTGPDTLLTKVDLERVAFEVDGVDSRARTGWSVCIHGVAREITFASDAHACRLRTELPVPWAPGLRQRVFAVRAREVTGRRLRSSSGPESPWLPGVPWS